MKLVEGRRYFLESSTNLTDWNGIGMSFIAESNEIENTFDVEDTGQYFRVSEVP